MTNRFFGKSWMGVLTASVLGLTGCFFGGGDDNKGGGGGSMACADLSPEQQRKGDSIVAIASARQGADLVFLFDSAQSWDEARARNLQPVLDLYNEALTAAPGHCGALFGRAVARAAMITQDSTLNNFIRRVNSDSLVQSTNALAHTSPDKAPVFLIKSGVRMRALDPVTISDVQTVVGTSLLPSLESALADLDQVMKYEKFHFGIRLNEDSVIIDHASLGPGLAGLKVVKAFMLQVVGYNWEIALNGNYGWLDTLDRIEDADFDNLRPGQTAALDHLEGLFTVGNVFSTPKPAYQAQVAAIPTLLLAAVQNVQDGLNYALTLSTNPPADKQYRLLNVGTTDLDDVDPADVRDMVDLLERSKKYLQGEVTVSYNHGRNQIRVDFPKVFTRGGLQGYLPYFKFNPYTQWNDTVFADTTWALYDPSGFDGAYALGGMTRPSLGYSTRDYGVSFYPYADSAGTFPFLVYPDTGFVSDTVALVTLDPDIACRIHYRKFADRITLDGGDSYQTQWLSAPETGTTTLKGCRDAGGGMLELAEYIDADTKGPFYFTDPQGLKTLGAEDTNIINNIDNPAQLKGLVYFRDPTFGGEYPGLNNDNIWDKVASLDSIEARTKEVCVVNPQNPNIDSCAWVKPVNPSDLDLFIYVMARMNQYSGALAGVPAVNSVRIGPSSKK